MDLPFLNALIVNPGLFRVDPAGFLVTSSRSIKLAVSTMADLAPWQNRDENNDDDDDDVDENVFLALYRLTV